MDSVIGIKGKESRSNIWILATDGSDCSFRALENLGRICFEDDTIYLLMVVRPIRFDSSDYKERKEEQEKECEKLLKRYKDYCKHHKIKFITEIQQGDPRETILATANRHKATYIVMGSRGLTGLKSLLMGSVSTYIVEQSNVPVLVVK